MVTLNFKYLSRINILDSKSYIISNKNFNELPLQKSIKRKSPKFLNQIPHFVLKPNDEALIDIDIEETNLPTK